VSDALRQIFAELGFKVDEATLDKAEKKLREYTGTAEKSGKATDKAAASTKKLTEDEKKAAKATEDLGKKLSTYSGIGEHVSDKAHARFGESLIKRFPQVEQAAKKYGVTSQGVGKAVVGASAAVVLAIKEGVEAAFAFADAFSAGAEALRDTARESRVTSTQLQEIDHAAAQAGVGVERMRSGLATFGQALRAGERGGNGTTFMLRRLGIQARDASGHIRPTGELLDEVAVAMEHIESPTRRARVATQLFGEAGRRMLDVLHTGPGGIRALREELAELGGGVTPEAVEASRRYTQATERLSRAQDSLRSTLAVALLPALSWLVDKGAKVAGLMARLTHGTHVVQIALAGLAAAAVAMAAPVIAAWAPIALPFVVVAAKVALLVAVLDDLMTFVEGGDSAMGRLIDSFAGAGTAVELAKELRDDWEAVVNAIERAIEAVARFTGIGASAASGSSRGPMIGGQRVTPRGPVPTVPDGAFRMRIGPQTVPATRTVAAPGSVSSRTRVTQINRTSAPVFHINGADPRATAAEAVRLMQQAERDRRDGDHPVEDDDDDAPARGVEG